MLLSYLLIDVCLIYLFLIILISEKRILNAISKLSMIINLFLALVRESCLKSSFLLKNFIITRDLNVFYTLCKIDS